MTITLQCTPNGPIGEGASDVFDRKTLRPPNKLRQKMTITAEASQERFGTTDDRGAEHRLTALMAQYLMLMPRE